MRFQIALFICVACVGWPCTADTVPGVGGGNVGPTWKKNSKAPKKEARRSPDFCAPDIAKELRTRWPQRDVKTAQDLERYYIWMERQEKLDFQVCIGLTASRESAQSKKDRDAVIANRQAAERRKNEEQAAADAASKKAYYEQEQCKREYAAAVTAQAASPDAVRITGPRRDATWCYVDIGNFTQDAKVVVSVTLNVQTKDGRVQSRLEQPYIGPKRTLNYAVGACDDIARVDWPNFSWVEVDKEEPTLCYKRP